MVTQTGQNLRAAQVDGDRDLVEGLVNFSGFRASRLIHFHYGLKLLQLNFSTPKTMMSSPSNRRMTQVADADDDQLRCQLCTLLFDDGAHTPMLLPQCGHSYCLACLQERVEMAKMFKGK